MLQNLLYRAASPAVSARRVMLWLALVLVACVGAVLLALLVPQGPVFLLGETGFFEAGSVAWYGLVTLTGTVTALFGRCPRTRWLAVWLAWVALLAGLRELDMHVVLNPKHLGEWGVRYRMDWWLNGSVSASVKLVWLGAFSAAAMLTVLPVWKIRRELLRHWRARGVALVCLPAGAACLVLGVVIDDPLRTMTAVSKQTKSLVEEGIEWYGAALICAGSLTVLRAQAEEDAARRALTPPA